jgi:predicted acyl esterase
LDREVEVAGFYRLSAWLSIDQPDTDFQVSVHEITATCESQELTRTMMRARYRTSQREQRLSTSTEPQHYEFDTFTFVARRLGKGSRLRLVFKPVDSLYFERNYNSGKPVAHETAQDARVVRVRLLHDLQHPSVLHVPIGAQGIQ